MEQTHLYIEPVVNSVINLFQSSLNMEIKAGRPYILDRKRRDFFDIFASIGIAGELKGSIIIAFKDDIASKIASEFWGYEIEETNDDVYDTIAEMVNIIAGNAKSGMEKYRLYISLPQVIKGNDLSLIPPSEETQEAYDVPYVCIPFRNQLGEFHVMFFLKNNS